MFKQNIFLDVLVFFLLTIVVSLGKPNSCLLKIPAIFICVSNTVSQILHQYVPLNTRFKEWIFLGSDVIQRVPFDHISDQKQIMGQTQMTLYCNLVPRVLSLEKTLRTRLAFIAPPGFHFFSWLIRTNLKFAFVMKAIFLFIAILFV